MRVRCVGTVHTSKPGATKGAPEIQEMHLPGTEVEIDDEAEAERLLARGAVERILVPVEEREEGKPAA